MKRIITSLGLLCLLGAACGTVVAQTQPMSDKRIRTNLSNARFLVNSPASQAGLKTVTLASWAGQLPTPLINVPVVAGIDSLAQFPLTNASAVAGKVCLLFRGGGITFAQKVQYANAAGAIGVIVVNNVPGEPIAMGNTGSATYTIPAVMVSDVVGQAMNNSLRNSVPVFVSMGAWGLGAAHDLAFLEGFQAAPHAMAIPASQLVKGTGRAPYRNFSAGAILNYGTSSESAISIADSVVWNPTVGGPTTVHQGTYNIPFIGSTDSVMFGFGSAASSWDLPFTNPTTGYFSYNYRMTYGNTDAYPEDNRYNFRQYVTDSIFCKGNYDFTRNGPKVTLGIQPSNAATGYCFGPLYYVADDSFAARKMQYTISKNSVTTLDGSETFALVYKWTDGSAGQPLDSFIEAPEMKLIGVSYKAFTTADTSGAVITIPVRDAVTPSKTVVLDSNSWYWIAAQATFDAFIGVDESINYFTRAYEQSQVFNYQEHPEVLYVNDYGNLATETGAMATFPFGGNALYVDSTFFDRFYYVPNVALHISKNKIPGAPIVGVETVGSPEIGEFNIFPIPANNFITVESKLAKNFDKVGYRLLDMGGRVVYTTDHHNVQNERFEIPTSNIAPGFYHLVVLADGMLTTRQVVITR